MADQADDAQVLEREHFERCLAKARQPIAVGVAGECEECGGDSLRLVKGWCAPCRDRRDRRG